MPTSFKKSLQGFLASVRSSVMENSSISLDGPLKRILGHQHASTWADVAFSNVMKCDNGLALLSALQTNYRITKASHYKKRPRMVLRDVAEHEFIVVHLRCKNKTTLFRIDRSIGHQAEHKSPRETTTSSEKSSYSFISSHTPSSSSTTSMESILMSPSRLVDYCVCQLSNISSNRHWALDTIVEITQAPSPTEAYELATIEFTGSSSGWPSLWDLIHIVQFLNQQSEEYNLIDAQCYWYADMVSSLLEVWCPDTKVTRHHGWQGTKSKTLDIPVPGTIKGLAIYKRNPQIVEDKRRLLLLDIESSIKSTMEFLDMRNGGDQTETWTNAVAESIERAKERVERAEERAERAEERAERAEERAERAEERAERAEERAEKAGERVERAEERAERAEERAEKAEERAERAEESAEKAGEKAERAEESAEKAGEKAERAEERATEAEAQVQELLKKFEARVSDSDALMARMVARLDEFKSNGLGQSIIA